MGPALLLRVFPSTKVIAFDFFLPNNNIGKDDIEEDYCKTFSKYKLYPSVDYNLCSKTVGLKGGFIGTFEAPESTQNSLSLYFACKILHTILPMRSIIMLMKNASIHFSATSILDLDLCCKLQRTAMCKHNMYPPIQLRK